ncbi:F-box only protein 28 [Drosophila hydei]|uniref:F-box only protein 28 n=1 Tax=Drosophila hydei TaxID=7224 RepID=A0A6J1MSX2_DROHY|nr:F-box only protein 28 [Drosophila hydei]
MHLLDLPDTVLMDILELLTYDEVARKREVCARFNYICQQVLNTGFNKVVQEHAKNFKRIKSLLPRRESERRNHMLARHSDILTSIETRISMLTMTYSKFIDLNICCFIPGRVLDEINSILKLLGGTSKPLRPHEVLQELRDISSMAIEHFDEKIAVNFKTAIKMNETSGSGSARVVVCGALGDISFNGVKVSPLKKVQSSHQHPQQLQQAQCHNMLCMNQKSDALLQQALLLAKTLPANADGTDTTQCNCNRNRLTRQLQRQWQTQKLLTSKVRLLESSRKAQERRLQEALGSITELATQVSELKRQLEDVLAKGKSMESSTTAASGAVKRPTVATECLPPTKKPKA